MHFTPACLIAPSFAPLAEAGTAGFHAGIVILNLALLVIFIVTVRKSAN